MNDPIRYFKAEIVDGSVETHGQRDAFFGYSYCVSGQEKPSGVWARWKYENDTLTVENDAIGYYPIFYYHDENCVIVSNSIIKLLELGADGEFDKDNLAVFCRCRFFLGNATAFKNIKSLLPNAKLIWENGKFDLVQETIVVKQQSLTVDQMVDGYVDLFRQAVKNVLTDDEFAMPLSGGRDSRQILFELLRNGKRPKECITCGESRDHQASRLISERIGLEHKFLERNQHWVQDEIRKNIASNFCALEHTWLMVLDDYLNDNYTTSYDGTGIGIYTRSELLEKQLLDLAGRNKYEDISRWLIGTNGYTQSILKKLPQRFSFIHDRLETAEQMIAEEIRKYSSASNPLSTFTFYTWNRTAIGANPFAIQKHLKVYAPFLDRELYEFVASYDPYVVLENEIQTLAINKAFPEYSDLPYYNSFEKSPQPRINYSSKVSNYANLFKLISKNHFRDIYPFLKNLALMKDGFARFESVLIYLDQLEQEVRGNK